MQETFVQGINIIDRYLVQLLVNKRHKPPEMLLVATITLLAAKFVEQILPSFWRMISLVKEKFDVLLNWQDIKDLESDICVTLGFNFNF